MGVYIPNEDMPEDCYTCFCYETEFNMCSLTGKRLDNIRIRQDDCPLIEIDEPKIGKWIDHKEIIYTDPEIWGYSQECSLCGFTLGAKEYNYCPNCGAKMIRE